MDSDEKQSAPAHDLLQPSQLTTEPTVAVPGGGTLGSSAENILGEEASLFDKRLIDVNTA